MYVKAFSGNSFKEGADEPGIEGLINAHPDSIIGLPEGTITIMNVNGQGSADLQPSDKSGPDHVVSAARRRALKIGLFTIPTMLTLRSKPVFAANACASLSLSAATSHGVLGLPGCNPKSLK